MPNERRRTARADGHELLDLVRGSIVVIAGAFPGQVGEQPVEPTGQPPVGPPQQRHARRNHKEALVPKRLELALRRLLETVLVVATAAAGYAAIRGRLPAATLGAIVPGLVALSVTVDHLNRSRGRPGRCVPRPGK